jgi:tRNA/rRNA methyltransferase
MIRNLRVAFGRALLSEQEVRTLRGVVTALSKGRGRVLAKLAAAKVGAPSPTGGGEAHRQPLSSPFGGSTGEAGDGGV